MNRRKFTETLLKATAISPFAIELISGGKQNKGLDILVLGGTYFVGPGIVKALLRNGHRVTLFNRGVTNPKLFPGVKHIRGDRTKGQTGYKSLLAQRKKWDAIIDVWPQESYLVDEGTSFLRSATDHYLFISSVAVYNDFSKPGVNEEFDLVALPSDRSEWGYSEHKVASENIVRDRFPTYHTILRCGPIKGWRDDAIDLPFWLVKLREGQVIAPGSGNDVIQFIDVNDIGDFVVRSIEKGLFGSYNLNGPQIHPLTWNEFLNAGKRAVNPNAEIIWVSEDFLEKHKVNPWDGMPLWLPEHIDPGFFRIDSSKAIEAGLTFTPIKKTLKDQFDWYSKNIQPDGLHQFGINDNWGITSSRYQELLQLLKK